MLSLPTSKMTQVPVMPSYTDFGINDPEDPALDRVILDGLVKKYSLCLVDV